MSKEICEESHDNEEEAEVSNEENYDKYGFSRSCEQLSSNIKKKVSLEIILGREMKWHFMFKTWDKWFTKRHERLRDRCRKGIPDSVRAEAWQRLCRSPATMFCKPIDAVLMEESSKQKKKLRFPNRLSRTGSLWSFNASTRKGSIGTESKIDQNNPQRYNTFRFPKSDDPENVSDPNLNSSSASSGYQSKDMPHPYMPQTIENSLTRDPDQYYTANTGSLNSDQKSSHLDASSIRSGTSDIESTCNKNTNDMFFNQDSSLLTETASTKWEVDQISLMVQDRVSTLVPQDLLLASSDPESLYNSYKSQPIDAVNEDQIEKDLARQFPHHQLFAQKRFGGQESLRDILRAYVVLHPQDGYCQGQAPIAAVLLMYMPEMNAFWTFNTICDNYLTHYYEPSLDYVQIDGRVLFGLLKSLNSQVHRFMQKRDVTPPLIMIEWFMCVYTRTLPWTCVLRVLDMFFIEGKSILFRVGLVILLRAFNRKDDRNKCPDLHAVLDRISFVCKNLDDEEAFIQEVNNCPVERRHIAREVKKQSKAYRKEMGLA